MLVVDKNLYSYVLIFLYNAIKILGLIYAKVSVDKM